MAKKSEKKTRASQYEAIVTAKGYKMNDCKVILFRFKDELESHNFHFDLMKMGSNVVIYDGPLEVVRITVLKEYDITPIIELSKKYDCEYKECHNYNDYE